MSILKSKDFNKFLYGYERKHCIDGVIHTVNKQGYATGEEQYYLDDKARDRIIDSFEHLTYEQRKEICMINRNKEEK